MKSPMIETANYIKDKGNYTELQVCRSNAGYYIGTMYNNPEGFQEPGSRDSHYFTTKLEAENYLDKLNKGEDLPLRMNP